MKLPFYSVAVIAMYLLVAVACTSSTHKSNEISNSSADVQMDVIAPPAVKKEENPPSLSGEFNRVSTDTTTETGNQASPPVLQTGGPTNEDWDKKIIKTAKVSLELKDYKNFNNGIHDKLKRYGAYIAGEQQTEGDTRIENTLIIKVPVAQFEDLMNSIGGEGIKVLEKNISTEDVTGEVVDTKSRIEAKKQVRDKYMELLKQAKTMKDILAVQEEVNTVQEDLEAASGRVAYLSHNAAFSAITLTYYQYLNGNSADTAEPAFLTKVKEAFAAGGTIISNIVLFFISVWPLVLAGGVLLVYIKRGKLKKGVI